MKQPKNLLLAGLALLLALSVAGYYWTRDGGRNRGRRGAGELPSMIDERLLKTAREMAATADTNEEQNVAREALRLSDHELDQAFATAQQRCGGGTILGRSVSGTTAASAPTRVAS